MDLRLHMLVLCSTMAVLNCLRLPWQTTGTSCRRSNAYKVAS
jgi:hypothetical protein